MHDHKKEYFHAPPIKLYILTACYLYIDTVIDNAIRSYHRACAWIEQQGNLNTHIHCIFTLRSITSFMFLLVPAVPTLHKTQERDIMNVTVKWSWNKKKGILYSEGGWIYCDDIEETADDYRIYDHGFLVAILSKRDNKITNLDVRKLDADKLLIDVVEQYADYDNGMFHSSGLSTLEHIFSYLIRKGYAKGDRHKIKLIGGDE